ncbi:MAG: hypothetical protein MMC33_006907 [Icmadophila ericetorum]|nr:hypothetical protein [Icmadophila ericetorum]
MSIFQISPLTKQYVFSQEEHNVRIREIHKSYQGVILVMEDEKTTRIEELETARDALLKKYHKVQKQIDERNRRLRNLLKEQVKHGNWEELLKGPAFVAALATQKDLTCHVNSRLSASSASKTAPLPASTTTTTTTAPSEDAALPSEKAELPAEGVALSAEDATSPNDNAALVEDTTATTAAAIPPAQNHKASTSETPSVTPPTSSETLGQTEDISMSDVAVDKTSQGALPQETPAQSTIAPLNASSAANISSKSDDITMADDTENQASQETSQDAVSVPVNAASVMTAPASIPTSVELTMEDNAEIEIPQSATDQMEVEATNAQAAQQTPNSSFSPQSQSAGQSTISIPNSAATSPFSAPWQSSPSPSQAQTPQTSSSSDGLLDLLREMKSAKKNTKLVGSSSFIGRTQATHQTSSKEASSGSLILANLAGNAQLWPSPSTAQHSSLSQEKSGLPTSQSTAGSNTSAFASVFSAISSPNTATQSQSNKFIFGQNSSSPPNPSLSNLFQSHTRPLRNRPTPRAVAPPQQSSTPSTIGQGSEVQSAADQTAQSSVFPPPSYQTQSPTLPPPHQPTPVASLTRQSHDSRENEVADLAFHPSQSKASEAEDSTINGHQGTTTDVGIPGRKILGSRDTLASLNISDVCGQIRKWFNEDHIPKIDDVFFGHGLLPQDINAIRKHCGIVSNWCNLKLRLGKEDEIDQVLRETGLAIFTAKLLLLPKNAFRNFTADLNGWSGALLEFERARLVKRVQNSDNNVKHQPLFTKYLALENGEVEEEEEEETESEKQDEEGKQERGNMPQPIAWNLASEKITKWVIGSLRPTLDHMKQQRTRINLQCDSLIVTVADIDEWLVEERVTASRGQGVGSKGDLLHQNTPGLIRFGVELDEYLEQFKPVLPDGHRGNLPDTDPLWSVENFASLLAEEDRMQRAANASQGAA